MPDRQDSTAAATPRGPSPRLKSRLALENRGNRPRPVALTDAMTPAQAFVGPTLTPNDLDVEELEQEWDEALEDAFFSEAPGSAVEVDTFPPSEARAAEPVFDAPVDAPNDDLGELDDIEDWVRPRSRWPARLFALGAATLVVGLAGFGFGMALEATRSDVPIALPSPDRVLAPPAATTSAEPAPEPTPELDAVDARIYPSTARPIAAIGPTEETPETRTATRRSWTPQRTLPSRRTVPKAAPPPPPAGAAPLSVRALKPAVSVSALPPAE